MKRVLRALAVLVVGALIGAGLTGWWGGSGSEPKSAEKEKQPLYWVAPMDDSYRRDQPGKSPMGMDLVPVYETADKPQSPGTVRISPAVENNLGVRTGVVERGALPGRIRTVGYVRYDEDSLLHIHPRVEGWVETLHIKAEGDPVKAGEPLYELYAPELVNAQRDYLLALRDGDQRLIRGARLHLQSLNFADKSIERLKERKEVMQSVTFYAPQSGVVDNLGIREGYFVQPSSTLMSIGVLDQVWVQAEVFARDALAVKAGQPVTMTLDALPGRQWQGEVDYIYPSLDESTRTLRLRLKFDNPDRLLKPNMFANVAIDTGAEPTLLAPREAVIRTGEQNRVVLALGEGRFKSVAVELGRVGERRVQILSGLKAGDRIVTSAQFLIDSESAKNSDFERLSAIQDGATNHSGMQDMDGMKHADGMKDRENMEGMSMSSSAMNMSMSHSQGSASSAAGGEHD